MLALLNGKSLQDFRRIVLYGKGKNRGFCIGEGEFQKGTGVHTAYDGNGNLMRITHYKDNLKDGAEISFASNGDTIQHLIFKEDHIIETLLDTINPIMPIDTIQ